MPITKARRRIQQYSDNHQKQVRGQEQRVRMVSLSLTSMVDMFAILVIFLLINASTLPQWIELGHNIHLPKAKANDQPQKAATFQISDTGIFAGTGKEALISSSDALKGMTIDPVRAWLVKNAKKGDYINIVADEKVQYGLVRRVVATCQDAGFQKVNLAVQPRS